MEYVPKPESRTKVLKITPPLNDSVYAGNSLSEVPYIVLRRVVYRGGY